MSFRLVTGGESLGIVALDGGAFRRVRLAERYPVGLDGVDAGGVTLTYSFVVAAAVLFGWEAAR